MEQELKYLLIMHSINKKLILEILVYTINV